jgi:hypothetical protein
MEGREKVTGDEEVDKLLKNMDLETSVAGAVLRRSSKVPGMLEADAWATGITKSYAATLLRKIADAWDAEEAAAAVRDAAERN